MSQGRINFHLTGGVQVFLGGVQLVRYQGADRTLFMFHHRFRFDLVVSHTINYYLQYYTWPLQLKFSCSQVDNNTTVRTPFFNFFWGVCALGGGCAPPCSIHMSHNPPLYCLWTLCCEIDKPCLRDSETSSLGKLIVGFSYALEMESIIDVVVT